jgi:hypothetical protein
MSTISTIPNELLPLDKSQAIRNGTKDIIEGYEDTADILEGYQVCTDIESMLRASQNYKDGDPVDVGESGTLLRILWFASTANGEDREFIRRGTLRDRAITLDPEIIHWPIEDLLTLDGGTTQFATASLILNPDQEIPEESEPKLQLTVEVMAKWAIARAHDEQWQPVKDTDAIRRQAEAYIKWLLHGSMDFRIEHAEDVPFGGEFDLITPFDAEARWPKLRNHESDRIAALGMAPETLKKTRDHRVMQAAAMRHNLTPDFFSYPESVAKSWPEFWDFMIWARALKTY